MMKKRFLIFSASLPFFLSAGHGMMSEGDYQNKRGKLQKNLTTWSKYPQCEAYKNAQKGLEQLEAQYNASRQAQRVVAEERPVAAAVVAPPRGGKFSLELETADFLDDQDKNNFYKILERSKQDRGSVIDSSGSSSPVLDFDEDLELARAISASEADSHSDGNRPPSPFSSLSEDEDKSAPSASAIPAYRDLGKDVQGRACYEHADHVPENLLEGDFQKKKYVFHFKNLGDDDASNYRQEIAFYEDLKKRVTDPTHKKGLEVYVKIQKKKLARSSAPKESPLDQQKMLAAVKKNPALPQKALELLNQGVSLDQLINGGSLTEDDKAMLIDIASQVGKNRNLKKDQGAVSAAPQKISRKVIITRQKLPTDPSVPAVAAAPSPWVLPAVDPMLAQQSQQVTTFMSALPTPQGLTPDAHEFDQYAKNNYPQISQLASTLLGGTPQTVPPAEVAGFLNQYKSTLQGMPYTDLAGNTITFDAVKTKIEQTWNRHRGVTSTQSGVAVDLARAISFRLLQKLVNKRGIDDASTRTCLQQFMTQAYDAGDTCPEGHINRHMLSTSHTLQTLTNNPHHR